MNCVISNNTANDSGGGVECWFASPQINNCIISSNYAGNYGGGVDCYKHDNTILTNCTLSGNSTGPGGKGGAVCMWGSDVNVSSVNIRNSILWANQAGSGAQLQLLYGTNIASVSYCNVQGGFSGIDVLHGQVNWFSGNIDSDPCFASFDPNGDPNLWDFHLQSSSGRWNPVFFSLELNNDGLINLVDFAGLAELWMETGVLDRDLNKSGAVDQEDLGIFTQYYLANVNEDGWLEDSSTSPCIDARTQISAVNPGRTAKE
jgi:hypothetical protein